MAVFRRNLWTLFWLIFIGGLILLSVILYHRWQSILQYQRTHHENRVELVAQAVDSLLRTQELVLDVVGRELLDDSLNLEASRQVPLLDSVLSVDQALVAFGLASPDGSLLRVSSNMDMERLPNLLTHPSTAESFQQTLDSDAMVLGRTYRVPALDTWVLPIRKALRNEQGAVVAVMTAGLRIGSGGTVLDERLHEGSHDSVMLFREADGYMQFMSAEGVTAADYSKIQIPPLQIESNRRDLETQLGMPVEQVKLIESAVSVLNERHGESFLTAAVFNPRYQLWVISETRLTPAWQTFSTLAIQYALVFISISSVLLLLCRVIDQAGRQRNEELLYHSTHDDLTGRLNRSGLLNHLAQRMRKRQSFGLVVININNFQGINDRYGQETGDATLVEFSRRLQELLDPDDTLARLGGDEFVIITPNTRLERLEPACHSLAEALTDSFQVGRLQLQISASIGIATYPDHGDSSSKLLRSAHLALYKAKQNRACVSLYRSEMEMTYLRRLTIEERLRLALVNGGLYMMYQPQMDEQGRMMGMEALVRWEDDELGFVSPAEFVAIAEQSGLMNSLGQFVLDTSLREYSELRQALGIRLDLGINISVIQFEQPGFVEEVLNVLERYQVPPQELVLEITETLVMHNVEQVIETIERLHQQGIRLSMDDFGTGYSSLSLLRRLPLDELKIDKSFVDSLLEDERAANMIQSIIYIARSHNMHVVVEGVELKDQTDRLIAMGCRRFQGYYFSRPETLAAIRERLSGAAPQPLPL
ncbi:putative bifunctional diguanylate cyclase/phosphodiesterase [Marinobacterium weihaiense]|uniref:EAL domain-containing protein n=1 Tax=Marinobacterium weihaiense TaxID=2851016 RepID=A0ABS6MD48_9GAMM|nr:EAL domain-containing protein [Marinobacterium weihaiense]MBV0934237.1 EAL domain-containing protein [Marinobacterium weihaiense]